MKDRKNMVSIYSFKYKSIITFVEAEQLIRLIETFCLFAVAGQVAAFQEWDDAQKNKTAKHH
jgi:hypothetical protein